MLILIAFTFTLSPLLDPLCAAGQAIQISYLNFTDFSPKVGLYRTMNDSIKRSPLNRYSLLERHRGFGVSDLQHYYDAFIDSCFAIGSNITVIARLLWMSFDPSYSDYGVSPCL